MVLSMGHKKILTFVDYYLPGYRAGGPIVSLRNMVKLLGDEIEFYIVTADRDLGDKCCYKNIKHENWQEVEGAKVLYLNPKQFSFRELLKIIKSCNWEQIYLNSFFSLTAIKIILLNYLSFPRRRESSPRLTQLDSRLRGNDREGRGNDREGHGNDKAWPQILLAPRGEFSDGALALKKNKKKLYLLLAKILGLYRNIIWHATDNSELINIQKIFGKKILYKIAHDPVMYEQNYFYSNLGKKENACKLVFISRIAKKKNLHICLEILNKIQTTAEIIFDIYGPIEDQNYWRQCTDLIKKAPKNIKINYCGQIAHQDVYATIANYHCFFLPTAGENFGHAIFESFMVGRPVLIGDDTPWKELKVKNIGADIAPSNHQAFIEVLNRYLAMGQAEFDTIIINCHNFALKVANKERQKMEQRALIT